MSARQEVEPFTGIGLLAEWLFERGLVVNRAARAIVVLLSAGVVCHLCILVALPDTSQLITVVSALIVGSLAVASCILLWKQLEHHTNLESSEQIRESLIRTQEQLVREQFLVKALVDNLPDAIYFKDLDSRFIRCNQATADVFRLASPNDLVGKSDHDFFSDQEADEYRADELHIIQTGEPIINKEEYECWPDGKYHWVLSTKLPLRDDNNQVIGTFGLSRDISALKLAEQRLAAKVAELEKLHSEYKREQSLFSSLVENIPDAVFFKDGESRFIRVNPAMAADAGFNDPDELTGLCDADIWGADLAGEALSDEQRIMQTGEPIIGKQEQVVRKSDNECRWVLATKMPLRSADGKIIGTFGVARDITTLKVTQEWLSESQERFELAVQGANDGLWDWNVQTGDVWFAPRFRELLGFEIANQDDLPNRLDSFTDRLHPDDRDRVLRSFDSHLEQHIPHDEKYRLRTASGEYRWFRGRGQAVWNDDGTAERMAGSIQDIHQQRMTEDQLARTRLQLEQALEGGHVGMWDWNVVTNEVFVSREVMLQLGENPDFPWTSLNDWEDRLHPEDKDAAVQRTKDYIANPVRKYESSFRLKHAKGGYRWILSRGKLFSDDGQPSRCIGVHVDITELRNAQAALAESEARFRGIFNQTFQFIGLLTPEGEIIDANRTALAAAGIAPEEVIGQMFWETAWWNHSPEMQERLRQSIDKAREGEFVRFEATHPTADGKQVTVDFSLKPVHDDDGKVVYLIPEGRDITQLKEFREQLQARSDELEQSNQELQQFAYVASHDLQEPLRTIVGFCQLLDMEYREQLDEQGQEFLNTIIDGGKRMQRLIRDLLEYSRVGRKGQPFQKESLRLAVDEAVALLHTSIQESGGTVTIEELPELWVDHGQMIRLFQNLIGNAIKYRGEAPPKVRICANEGPEMWKITVSDNGIGIADEFAEQIFIIFKRLHTREEYPGTGIGLAICRRIVERHGGTIQLVPGQSTGSTFEVTFPKNSPA